jgi:hypothetical protein
MRREEGGRRERESREARRRWRREARGRGGGGCLVRLLLLRGVRRRGHEGRGIIGGDGTYQLGSSIDKSPSTGTLHTTQQHLRLILVSTFST